MKLRFGLEEEAPGGYLLEITGHSRELEMEPGQTIENRGSVNRLLLRPFYFLVILKKVPCEKASILWSLLREEGEGSGSCDEPKAEGRWETCVIKAVTTQPSHRGALSSVLSTCNKPAM